MAYRITIDVMLENKGKATAIFNILKNEQVNFITINPGAPNEEKSRAYIHECYHDENPSRPCVILDRLESD